MAGSRPPPLVYKHQYLDLLWERIKDRGAALKAGRVPAGELMVPGARAILEAMRARDVQCYLASGTDESAVLDEAAALHIVPYFRHLWRAGRL